MHIYIKNLCDLREHIMLILCKLKGLTDSIKTQGSQGYLCCGYFPFAGALRSAKNPLYGLNDHVDDFRIQFLS